jgi:hypothetical protein
MPSTRGVGDVGLDRHLATASAHLAETLAYPPSGRDTMTRAEVMRSLSVYGDDVEVLAVQLVARVQRLHGERRAVLEVATITKQGRGPCFTVFDPAPGRP